MVINGGAAQSQFIKLTKKLFKQNLKKKCEANIGSHWGRIVTPHSRLTLKSPSTLSSYKGHLCVIFMSPSSHPCVTLNIIGSMHHSSPSYCSYITPILSLYQPSCRYIYSTGCFSFQKCHNKYNSAPYLSVILMHTLITFLHCRRELCISPYLCKEKRTW